MKKWNTPELTTLDINMTENGKPRPWPEQHIVVDGNLFGYKFHEEWDTTGVVCPGNQGQTGSKGGEQTSGNEDTDLPSGL